MTYCLCNPFRYIFKIFLNQLNLVHFKYTKCAQEILRDYNILLREAFTITILCTFIHFMYILCLILLLETSSLLTCTRNIFENVAKICHFTAPSLGHLFNALEYHEILSELATLFFFTYRISFATRAWFHALYYSYSRSRWAVTSFAL